MVSKTDHILHCSLLSILHREIEDGELSKDQNLQHTKEYLDAGLPGGSALLLEPLDFSTLQHLLYFKVSQLTSYNITKKQHITQTHCSFTTANEKISIPE